MLWADSNFTAFAGVKIGARGLLWPPARSPNIPSERKTSAQATLVVSPLRAPVLCGFRLWSSQSADLQRNDSDLIQPTLQPGKPCARDFCSSEPNDRVNPINYGSIPTLDSIIAYDAAHGTVCGTLDSGNTTGPIGIDPTAKSVTDTQIASKGPVKIGQETNSMGDGEEA
jgi:hypothetical protein